EGRVRGELLEDLIHGTYGDENAAQRRARHLGYPLAGLHVLMVVDVDDFAGFVRARQLSEELIQALKRDYLRRVSAVVRTAYPRALLGARSDSVMALLPVSGEADVNARLQGLGAQVKEAVAEWKPGFTVSIGFSPEEGEQQRAARRLKIHPNTLRYRLDRIREISGVDLDDPETRLNMSVALRVHGLLGL